jgi:hypothetical protein
MAVKIKTVLLSLKSKLQASGRFKSVSIGDPSEPPNSPHAAVILRRYEHTTTTLGKTVERRTAVVRIYQKAFESPEDTEYLLDDIIAEVEEDIFGDLKLGGTIRNVEPLGVTVEFGYLAVGRDRGGAGIMYRIADISIPMIVDDSATFAQ